MAGGTFYYDENGNTITRRRSDLPGGNQTLEYDDLDMPWRITGESSGATDIQYDAAENRMAKWGPAETTLYAGDLYECVGPTPASSPSTFACAEHRYKVYVGGRMVAQVTRAATGQTSDVATSTAITSARPR